jgi:hypothetical protein
MSIDRYPEIKQVLDDRFSGLRIRFGCSLPTLRSATPVRRARARARGAR